MNRKEFSDAYAKKKGISKGEAAKICESVFDFLYACIRSNNRVYIKGLGAFSHKTRSSKRIGNIHGGEPIVIPEKDVIEFSPYTGLPLMPLIEEASTTVPNNKLLAQTIATSIEELGLDEFIKRCGILSAAMPYEVDYIYQRAVQREIKGVCPYCGKEFKKRYSHQKYCNGKCREANYRRGTTEFSAYEYDHKNA